MAGANLLSNPSDIWSGLPFSLTLMSFFRLTIKLLASFNLFKVSACGNFKLPSILKYLLGEIEE